MTDLFSKMVEDNRPMLTETLEKIAAVIDEAADTAQAEGKVVEPDSVFANAVIEWLADDNVIRIPSELQEDEHFMEHRFSAVVGRSRIACWGSALFRQPVLESSYDLHLFVSDWHDTLEPLEFRTEDYQKLSSYVLKHSQFYGL